MKTKVIASFFALLVTTSIMAADTPPVEAQLSQSDNSPEMFALPGAVNVQYQLTIKNPLVNHSITLRRLTLRTHGQGAYSLQADDSITMIIAPESSVTINLAEWAHSRGGFKQNAPVAMTIRLWFDRQDGKPFSKRFVQDLPQF